MVNRPVNQMTPVLQFVVFLALSVLIIFIGNLIGLGVIIAFYGLNLVTDISHMNFTNPQTAQALYLLQIISTTIPILIAPVVFAFFVVKEPAAYLKNNFRFHWVLLIVAFFIMLISSPLIELLSNINDHLALPKFLSGVERWMRNSEDSAQKLTKAILKMDTLPEMLKNVFLIGLLTAIVEEFMFRGALQTIMQRWTKNTHAAIWITAALFSAFHMEFFGFLPRMFLGALFGYFVAWSGSIWPAVWGHFLNNGSAVVVTYLYQQKKIKLNPDDTHTFSYSSYLFSLIIIIILLQAYKYIASGKKQAADLNGEELG